MHKCTCIYFISGRIQRAFKRKKSKKLRPNCQELRKKLIRQLKKLAVVNRNWRDFNWRLVNLNQVLIIRKSRYKLIFIVIMVALVIYMYLCMLRAEGRLIYMYMYYMYMINTCELHVYVHV